MKPTKPTTITTSHQPARHSPRRRKQPGDALIRRARHFLLDKNDVDGAVNVMRQWIELQQRLDAKLPNPPPAGEAYLPTARQIWKRVQRLHTERRIDIGPKDNPPHPCWARAMRLTGPVRADGTPGDGGIGSHCVSLTVDTLAPELNYEVSKGERGVCAYRVQRVEQLLELPAGVLRALRSKLTRRPGRPARRRSP